MLRQTQTGEGVNGCVCLKERKMKETWFKGTGAPSGFCLGNILLRPPCEQKTSSGPRVSDTHTQLTNPPNSAAASTFPPVALTSFQAWRGWLGGAGLGFGGGTGAVLWCSCSPVCSSILGCQPADRYQCSLNQVSGDCGWMSVCVYGR